jgi:hypothetical protein
MGRDTRSSTRNLQIHKIQNAKPKRLFFKLSIVAIALGTVLGVTIVTPDEQERPSVVPDNW